MELFGCQTCESAYHAECMTPSLDPDIVPNFWFCPHCVDKELHIPPSLPDIDELSPISTRDQHNSHSGDTPKTNSVTETTVTGQSPAISQVTEQSYTPIMNTGQSSIPKNQVLREQQPTTQHKPGPRDQAPQRKGKAATAKKSSSPPRKKSKYSSFSANVDKALSVIYSELETAAQNGRSEDGLQEKIKALEQQLKVQEGEIQLARNERANEHLKNERLNREIAHLKEEVEKKDAELRDWQAKLKTLMGGSPS